MGVYRFSIPDTLPEMVRVLNEAFPGWNVWVVEWDPQQTMIFTGDQLCFTAHTRQEAEAYLAGIYSVSPVPDHLLRRYTESSSSRLETPPDR